MADEKLKLLPLGGLGEIGMNCLVMEWQDSIVLLDCGIQFPDASYPGVELFAPDFDYLLDRKEKLRGVVITHGHDDHIGSIPYLLKEFPLHVHCTPFPEGLIRQKLSEQTDLNLIEYHRIEPRKRFSVGPFTFDPIPVQHSIIEALGFGIETPVGNLVHSGDFKHDPLDFKGQTIGFGPFEEWGKRGVHLLLSDSTNAEKTGHTLSEHDITASFEKILTEQSSRILIALFASNVRRLENLMQIASRLNKKVALVGRSMHSYTQLAHQQDSLNIPENTLILPERTKEYPDDRVIILATGSQAEPQSALVRMAHGIHKDIEIKSGDLVIMSSRFIPGNEKAITAMINQLYRLGAEVLYEAIHQIHVSGHGFQEELLMMLRACKPKHFVPVHGEYRHLSKHARLAQQVGVEAVNTLIIEDGQSIEVSQEGIALGEKIELQRTAIVGGCPLEHDEQAFTQRNGMAKAGVVFAAFFQDAKSGKLIVPPQLSTNGLLYRKGHGAEETLSGAVEHLEAIFKESQRREDLREVLRIEVRRFLKKRVSYKPIVLVTLLEV